MAFTCAICFIEILLLITSIVWQLSDKMMKVLNFRKCLGALLWKNILNCLCFFIKIRVNCKRLIHIKIAFESLNRSNGLICHILQNYHIKLYGRFCKIHIRHFTLSYKLYKELCISLLYEFVIELFYCILIFDASAPLIFFQGEFVTFF